MRSQRMFMDLIIVLIMMVSASFILPTFYREIQNPGVRYHEDKTALDVENAIYFDSNIVRYDKDTNTMQYMYTGGHLMLMLLVQDEFSQAPNKVRIGNSYYVTFNPGYIADKYDILNEDYDTKIKPYVNKTVYRVKYMYPSSSTPGVLSSYFWFDFREHYSP